MSFLTKVPRTSTVQWRWSSAMLSSVRGMHTTKRRDGADRSFRFVVCGAGAGGLAVGSTLARRFGRGKLAIIEPAEVDSRKTRGLWPMGEGIVNRARAIAECACVPGAYVLVFPAGPISARNCYSAHSMDPLQLLHL